MSINSKFNKSTTLFYRFVSYCDRYILTIVRILSIYAVPLLIAVVSLIALTNWDNFYEANNKRALSLRVLASNDVSPGVEQNEVYVMAVAVRV